MYEEWEAEQYESTWDYDSEAYGATARDAQLFAATEVEPEPTQEQLARWAEADARRAAMDAWDAAWDAACIAAGDLPF